MNTFIDEIIADIDWRVAELATLKSIPKMYSFSSDHKDLIIKYIVPAIYALWEGFVNSCFTIYSHHLNSLSIPRSEISLPLLTHLLDSECGFNDPRIQFEAKQKMVTLIDKTLTDTIVVKPKVPTESNVNLKVLNKILERFCIEKIPDNYKDKLDKLLLFRNKIVHGENSIRVDMGQITEFIKTVEDLMWDIAINIEKDERLMTYKKTR